MIQFFTNNLLPILLVIYAIPTLFQMATGEELVWELRREFGIEYPTPLFLTILFWLLVALLALTWPIWMLLETIAELFWPDW